MDVHLNSVAWAGWAGMLVTALNLIPAGQLDGGHIAYALLGPRARYLTWAVIATLLALSTVWYGWLLWAGLVLLLGRVYSVPMDDVTGLRSREIAIAVLTIVVFILVFIPVPILER
ncbi:MAG: site-2 protease family protein [Actinobacteria bacterium]|nr:site-2 protease family protein [Actinomycetota bacterium]